jgi:carboxypeptidase Q
MPQNRSRMRLLMHRTLALALLLHVATAAAAALPAEIARNAEQLREAARQSSGGPAIVKSLTDGVGPRLAGSPGSRAAESWALGELKKLGFENVHVEKLMEPRWVRGKESGEVVAPVRQKLVLAALGGSAPTPSGGLERPVVAVENVAALQELLRREPNAARDRIVFYRQRMERSRDGSGYGAAVGIRFSGPFEAARAGAAGVLIRTVGTSGNRLPHTGAMKVEAGSRNIPAAALSGPDADLLDRLAGQGPVTVRFTLGCRTLSDEEAANIVGEIRGATKPAEVVLLGAHLDSWDLGTGAIDDAAGVAIVLEAARLIAALPSRPQRTIRVVLYANEENGGRGSQAYAQAHRAEMEHHVSALEMDLGTDRVYRMSWLAGPEGEAPLGEIADLLKPLGVAEQANDTDGGADVGRLREFGVPLIELNQDATRYFDIHHSADDTFDKIDAGNLKQVIAATAVVAYVAADMPGTFGRVPVEKRKVPQW